MAPALDDYEYQYDDDGVLLNATTAGHAAALPFIDVTKVSGLDSPEFRTSEHDHEGFDGGYVDSEYMKTRTIIIDGTLYADPSDADTVCDSLRYNYRPRTDNAPFYYKHPNATQRVVFGKGQGVRYDVENLRRTGQTAIQMTIACPDPYIYDSVSVSASGTGQGIDPGHGFNHGFNHGFGGLGPGGNQIDIFNGGNHRAYPIVTITGPIAQPSIIESRTGNTLEFDLTLAKGVSLVIDTRKHTAKESGTINRRATLVPGSKWWYVDPGTSTITLLGTTLGSETFTATSTGTVNTFVGADADAVGLAIGDKFHLFDATDVLRETTVFEITAISSAAGSTTVTFTPDAAVAPVSTDKIKTGVATFDVTLRSTWY